MLAFLLAITGLIHLRGSAADTFTVSAEAESGVVVGTAGILDQQAGSSGESLVRFGNQTGSVSCDQAGIQKLVDSVTTTSIEANLRKLVQDDTKPTPNQLISRHISSPGNKIKTDWARQQYVSYGLQDVSQDFTASGHQVSNVVARLAGTTTPDTIYAAGGHIDSISEQKTAWAPGANDDGTGTIAAMEAGRVLKPFQPCLKSTIDFIGFNDEEEGMQGSVVYVDSVKSKSFKGIYNMDMLGLLDGSDECIYNYYNDATRDQPLATRLESVGSKYGIGLTMNAEAYEDEDQDGANFWSANLPALFVNQCGSTDSHYHSTTDQVEFVNLQQVTKATKAVVAALAELGMQ